MRNHRIGLGLRLPVAAALLAGVLLLMVGSIAGAQPQNTSLPFDDYVELIEIAEAALVQAAPDEADAILAEQVRHLAAVEAVQYPSGQVVTVDPLLGTDASPSLTPDAALARLRTVRAQLAAAENDNTPARLAALEAILARPEFNTPISLVERIAIWLRDLLRRWFPNLNLGSSPDIDPRVFEIILWFLGGIGVITIIVLLTGWIRRLAESLLSEAEAERPDLFGDLPRTAAEARQQAQEAAQSGAYRDAVRRLYLAALLRLAEARLLPFDPSLTNREVLARLRPDSPVRPHLEPVVATFDRVWYGIQEPDRATFDRYAAAIDALDRAARQAATERTATSQAVAQPRGAR